ncbi:MAG: hypothetical protein AAF415_12135 [Pseudomonadota bacterium]
MIAQLAGKSWVHMLGAFLMMGGWAFWANSAHTMPKPLIAAAIQGTLSAGITFGLKRTVEALAAQLEGLAALVVPPLVAFAISLIGLSTIHWLGGTPEIWATIALPMTVATLYATVYNWIQWRWRRS